MKRTLKRELKVSEIAERKRMEPAFLGKIGVPLHSGKGLFAVGARDGRLERGRGLRVYIYVCVCLSLSLSLYIYIYIYI